MVDDGGRSSDYTPSAENISDHEDLDRTNDLVDAAEAKFPPYSNGAYNVDNEVDPYEAEERLAIQEESAETNTIEVGGAYNVPEFEYVTTADRLAAVVPDLLTAPIIGLDTETTGLDPLKDQLRLIQLATPTQTVVVDAFTCRLRCSPRSFLRRGRSSATI